jgi:thiopeptide-type bacteriocin biosynthesis protein
MKRASGQKGAEASYRPSGFFGIRTPLLPFDEYEAWDSDLEAPAILDAGGDDEQLESALTRDFQRLSASLRAAWERPEVREAVFIASPDLDRALAEKSDSRAIRSLLAYFTRMTSRCTPFGLFAGCSLGSTGQRTCIRLSSRSHYGRHTRLDMEYVSNLVAHLEEDAQVRAAVTYRPNTGLYRVGERLHYAESRLGVAGRSYHLVAVDASEYLLATLQKAQRGARRGELARALTTDRVSDEEASGFIDDLIANQLLVSDLEPAITGPEAMQQLLASTSAIPGAATTTACLHEVSLELGELDLGRVGNDVARYRDLVRRLEVLPCQPDIARLIQVDMVKPAEAELGAQLVDELVRGVGLLMRLARPSADHDQLRRFRERFQARYESAQVPLAEVLDEEVGIGFEGGSEPGGEPLLQDLPLPETAVDAWEWLKRDRLLLAMVNSAVSRGERVLELDAAAIDQLSGSDPQDPQAALEVFASLAAPAGGLERGDYQICLHGVAGPPGARMLGRFCHSDPELHRRVLGHLRGEESLRPGAVYAEIVHLPEGRMGNILARPVLREYEIPYLGRSGAPLDRQMPITDLLVSVHGDRVGLRSASLDREVVPRLTNAHNFTGNSLGVYRFLCSLQSQDGGGAGWSWGPLMDFPYLPRVTSGRLVLERARWNLDADELRPLLEADGAARFRAAGRLRERRGIPRLAYLAEGDNELLIDFDNVLSLDTFVHQVKRWGRVALVELFPEPDELTVTGPEGRFVSELVVPLLHQGAPAEPLPGRPRPSVARRFLPGSEWLYAKAYVGAGNSDRLLLDVIRPFVAEVLRSGAADCWYFIRYADPEQHLRLRFHGDPTRLAGEVLPHLRSALQSWLNDGTLVRLQIDTYERELERYGGDAGMALSERIFEIDSEAVLDVLAAVPGDEGLGWRWKLGLAGLDVLIRGLGLWQDRVEWTAAGRARYAEEFRADAAFNRRLAEKLRTERQGLEELLAMVRDSTESDYPAVAALQRFGLALQSPAAELRAAELAGALSPGVPALAASFAHMHLNRQLRSAPRLQEFVLFDLLERIYRSEVARARPKMPPTDPASV